MFVNVHYVFFLKYMNSWTKSCIFLKLEWICKKFYGVNGISCLHFLHNYSWISSSGCRDLLKKFLGWKPDCGNAVFVCFFFHVRKALCSNELWISVCTAGLDVPAEQTDLLVEFHSCMDIEGPFFFLFCFINIWLELCFWKSPCFVVHMQGCCQHHSKTTDKPPHPLLLLPEKFFSSASKSEAFCCWPASSAIFTDSSYSGYDPPPPPPLAESSDGGEQTMLLQNPNPQCSLCTITCLLPHPIITLPRGLDLKLELCGEQLFPEFILLSTGLPLNQSFYLFTPSS